MPALNLDSGVLNYEITGNGPAVLFIQGAGTCGSGWEYQVQKLSRDYTCLSFDNRGIGKSTADSSRLTIEQMTGDALALLDCAGWDSAHVVGHSMGGLIAEQLAMDAPQRVQSLSLLCTFASGTEAVRPTPAVIWLGIRTRLGTKAMRRRAFLQMLFPDKYLNEQLTEAFAAKVGRIVGRDIADSPSIMMKQMKAMSRYDARACLPKLSPIPTLVVSAQYDLIARPEFGRGICAQIAGSRYVEIPNAGHGVIIQVPERVNELLGSHFVDAEVNRAGIPGL